MGLPGPEFGDGTQWDGTSKARPDLDVYKAPDGDLGNRHSSEILALEELMKDAYATLDILANPGAANSVLGVLDDQSALEYKTLVEGANITITHGTGNITIASTGSGGGGGGQRLRLRMPMPVLLQLGHLFMCLLLDRSIKLWQTRKLQKMLLALLLTRVLLRLQLEISKPVVSSQRQQVNGTLSLVALVD